VDKRKVLVILSQIQKALEHEWFVSLIDRKRFDIEFVLINARGSEMDKFLHAAGVRVFHFTCHGKSAMPLLTWKLFRLMQANHYDVVHAHLYEAYLSGMTAAKLAGVRMRVITRHHSDLHHTWHPHAVKYDRYINWLSTDIIAISGIVKQILHDWEKVPEHKIHLIPHGIELSRFQRTPELLERVELLKLKYAIGINRPVIGVISRFTEWKGVQFIIPAFKKLLVDHPDALLLLANAVGDFKEKIKVLLKEIPDRNFKLIEFESDVPALYGMMDYFVHVPISRESEAFGQVYVEALAANVPSVFTLSGIATDFAIDSVNCMVVPFCDSDSIYIQLKKLILHPELAGSIVVKGYEMVRKRYDVKYKIKLLEELYTGRTHVNS
jgi:glycosyltransferase involved in cell wall biosynthesis